MQRDIQAEHEAFEAAERATLRGQKREVAVQAVRAAAAVYNAAVDAAEAVGVRVSVDWADSKARTGHYHLTPRFLADFDAPEPDETWIRTPPKYQPLPYWPVDLSPMTVFKGW